MIPTHTHTSVIPATLHRSWFHLGDSSHSSELGLGAVPRIYGYDWDCLVLKTLFRLEDLYKYIAFSLWFSSPLITDLADLASVGCYVVLVRGGVGGGRYPRSGECVCVWGGGVRLFIVSG